MKAWTATVLSGSLVTLTLKAGAQENPTKRSKVNVTNAPGCALWESKHWAVLELSGGRVD